MSSIENVIGKREADNLRDEFYELLGSGNANYGDVEDLLLGYGLEMDYFDQLCF